MPSWNDGESSNESSVRDVHPELDYRPDFIDDPSWSGIAGDAPDFCRYHNRMPERFVAFEGTNTGRRLYACSVEPDIINCGFLHWVDPEWPPSLKHALKTVWRMYHESNDRRIDEKIENGKLVKELCDEKTKLQKKYQNLLEEVHNWMDSTERQVQIQNYARIMHDRPEMKQNNEDSKLKLMEILKNQFEKDLAEMEIQRNKLQDELVNFKKEQAANLELMQFREK